MASFTGHFLSIIRFAAACAAVAVAPPAVFAQPAERGYAPNPEKDVGDLLRIPGFPPVQLPPETGVHGRVEHALPPMSDETNRQGRNERDFGTRLLPNGQRRPGRASDFGSTIIGPGGVIKPLPRPANRAEAPHKKPMTQAERAEVIRKALAPRPPLALARRHTLDDLYTKLAASTDADEAKGLATLIGNIWMRSGSDTANLLMQRAVQSVERKNYTLALGLLDRIVELQPNWAEAWNKRASVRYVSGNLDGSMADVEHVLQLEPKHFGALEGMAMILQRTGFEKQALAVYRRLLAVYPHQPEVQKTVEKLSLDVEGQGI